MQFFQFEHARVPLGTLGPMERELAKHKSKGKKIRISPRGEDLHYFGHTDDAMMKVAGRFLTTHGIPYTEVAERELPSDKRRLVEGLRKAGQLG